MASPTQLPGLPAGAADPCVHCGFCLPTCASYRVLASEMDSPRGRIHALRAIEAGDLELDATVASHFDTCLGCYACVSACPSGVRYDQLIEATHGTAPKHAGLDRINPGSVILSGVMMLEFLGWQEAADLVTKGLSAAIADKQVTYDLARLMEPKVDPVSCSGFAEAIIQRF